MYLSAEHVLDVERWLRVERQKRDVVRRPLWDRRGTLGPDGFFRFPSPLVISRRQGFEIVVSLDPLPAQPSALGSLFALLDDMAPNVGNGEV